MSDRFFSDTPITGDRAVLDGAEAHHLLHVMRLKPGARVALFDGSGAEFAAEVTGGGRRAVELAILGRHEISREQPQPITIAAALPKGDRQRWMVEKLTELGVARLLPITTERTVTKPTPGAMEKLRRVVIEASKQCRRNRLMEIAAAAPWPDLLADASLPASKYVAHPTGDAASHRVEAPAIIAIGPEGGFSDEEVTAAIESGWRGLDLGPSILRTETAAIAAAALASR